MSAAELAGWRQFYDLEPWGWQADCYRAGIVAALLANIHRDTRRQPFPFKPLDFVPQPAGPDKGIDGKALLAKLRTAFLPFYKKKGGGDGR